MATDNLMEELDDDKTYHEDASFCFIKIRCNFGSEEECTFLAATFMGFLESVKLEFHDYTCGKHYDRKTDHFHLHIILPQNKKSVPRELNNHSYWFKDKYLSKIGYKPPSRKSWYSFKVESPYTDYLQPCLETACNKFLRYPLKEGKPYDLLCSPSDDVIKGMISTAKEEYRFAEEQKLKKYNQELLKVTKYNEVRDYLDSKEISIDCPETIWFHVASALKNDSNPPTIKQITTMTEKYFIQRSSNLSLLSLKHTKHLRHDYQ